MIPYKRREAILSILQNRDLVYIEELMKEIPSVSESTIRRDIKTLEEQGFISHHYGGAIKYNGLVEDVPINTRKTKLIEEKERIAKYIADNIADRSIVYIDSGTSTTAVLKYLKPTVSVITSSIDLRAFEECPCEIYIIGGNYSKERASLYGAATIYALEHSNFDIAVLGANGYCESKGITTASMDEAFKKQTVIEKSAKVMFSLDHSKEGVCSFAKICDIDEHMIVTDEKSKLSDKFENIIAVTKNDV